MSTDKSLSVKKSSVLPFWLFGIAASLFGLVSWAARGVGSWIWVSIAILVVSLAIVLLLRFLPISNLRSKDWYTNVQRLGCAGTVAGALGFLIRFFFATATVYVENDNTFDVKLMMNGREWLNVPAKTHVKKSVTKGEHRIEVYPLHGDQKLDEHLVEIQGQGRYVLNVLGSQTFFLGEVAYLGQEPLPAKVIQEKWFEFPHVDHVFEDPPKVLQVKVAQNFSGAGDTVVKRTFLTKGSPPQIPKLHFPNK